MSLKCEVIADTVSVHGARITTMQVYFPRFLLAELNTHRLISKNVQSSRAIPVSKRIEMVRNDPFLPSKWFANCRGMSVNEESDNSGKAESVWIRLINNSLDAARALESFNIHKTQTNRVLESFTHVEAVLTATEWDNFFRLRCSPEADPAFQEMALIMQESYKKSIPNELCYHLPYVDGRITKDRLPMLQKISAARCARVSYKTFDGAGSTAELDIALCDRLIKEGHLSPFDHQAMADNYYEDFGMWERPRHHRQYVGWIPYRVRVEKELGLMCARSSFEPFDAPYLGPRTNF